MATVALAVPSSAAAYQDSWVTLSDIPLDPAYRGISPNLAQSGGKIYVLGGSSWTFNDQLPIRTETTVRRLLAGR